MSSARRVALDVGVGMTAAIAVVYARRVVALRRFDRGEPVRRTRWLRRVERERAKAAANWAEHHIEDLRALLTTSEKASVQLGVWDNARRTSEAMRDSARVVEASLAAADRSDRSSRDALQVKLWDLAADAAPHEHVATVAEAELAHLQDLLRAALKTLRDSAPADVTGPARHLVAAHDTARRPQAGHLNELLAQRRLAEVSSLRESLEATLARLVDAP